MKKYTFTKSMSCTLPLVVLFVIGLATTGCVNPKQEIRQEVRQETRDERLDDGIIDIGDPVERKLERKVDRKF